MQARVLRLGLLGTGVAARKLYLPALEQLGGRVEVVACCNRTKAKARAFAKLARVPHVVNTPEELFARSDVDAVFISLPIDAQPAFVLQALAAGKPVLSEKPVGPDAKSAAKLIARAARYDVPWLVGENYEFMPQLGRLRTWLREGKLGQVRLVEVNQVTRMNAKNPYFHTSWRQAPRHTGGFVVDGGVHLSHVVIRCFGVPSVVRGLHAQFDPALPPVDSVVAALRFESGALGTWRSCFSASYHGPMLQVYGSVANAALGYDWASLIDGRGREKRYPSKENSFARQLLHFRDVVQAGAPLAVTPADALEDLRLIERLLA